MRGGPRGLHALLPEVGCLGRVVHATTFESPSAGLVFAVLERHAVISLLDGTYLASVSAQAWGYIVTVRCTVCDVPQFGTVLVTARGSRQDELMSVLDGRRGWLLAAFVAIRCCLNFFCPSARLSSLSPPRGCMRSRNSALSRGPRSRVTRRPLRPCSSR